jgi:cytochrome P450
MREAVTGDFVADFAKVLPGFAMRHYLGVPESDRAAFDTWVELFVQGDAAGHDQAAPQAVAELGAYLATLVEERRASPGEDLVSAFLLPDGPEVDHFTLEEILGFIFVFISGGNDTVAGALGGTAELLTRHPDQAARLAKDASLVPGAVEEFLRLVSPAQGLARLTTRAVSVSGTDIPAGSRVLLCYGAANRDDREFGDSAEELDIERPITRTLAFGSGAHFCLGAAVARLQLKVALEELLELPHLEVDHDAGVFADGMFLRRYETLPYATNG